MNKQNVRPTVQVVGVVAWAVVGVPSAPCSGEVDVVAPSAAVTKLEDAGSPRETPVAPRRAGADETRVLVAGSCALEHQPSASATHASPPGTAGQGRIQQPGASSPRSAGPGQVQEPGASSPRPVV